MSHSKSLDEAETENFAATSTADSTVTGHQQARKLLDAHLLEKTMKYEEICNDNVKVVLSEFADFLLKSEKKFGGR